MTTRKHTSGPWEVSGNGVWGVSPWNARFRIATVTTPSPMSSIDWQANARLIAAAPLLLEALVACRGELGDLTDYVERSRDDAEPDARRVLGLADAAIAEATGGAA